MKKGFTLAEVLITLGVVGVVAVLTVPGVMRNYANRMYVSQLEKVYSQISEATQSIMNDEHLDNFRETSAAKNNSDGCPADLNKCAQGPAYFLNNYFKTAKTYCGHGGTNTCATGTSNYYKRLDNTSIKVGIPSYCIQTVSGAAICASYNANNKCMSIVIDVNGLAQPNVAGRDVFAVDVHENGSLSDYASGCVNGHMGASADTCGSGSSDSVAQSASGCLNKVIQDGWKMEY